jgi:hypothetical protein
LKFRGDPIGDICRLQAEPAQGRLCAKKGAKQARAAAGLEYSGNNSYDPAAWLDGFGTVKIWL